MNAENINAIKARYKASFAEKKKMIDDFHRNLVTSNGQSDELFQEIHSDLHKLAGSLGMYGYDGMAAQARIGMSLADEQEKQPLTENLELLSSMFLENS